MLTVNQTFDPGSSHVGGLALLTDDQSCVILTALCDGDTGFLFKERQDKCSLKRS